MIKTAHWLLAETTRRAELQSGSFTLDDAATRAAARLDSADVSARIVERAKRRDLDGSIQRSIADTLNGLRWAFGLLLLLGLLAGVAAAQTILAADGVIRLSWAILTLLGLPTLMLLIWLVVTLWPKHKDQPANARGLPGRVFWWLSSLFARRFSTSPQKRHLAASLMTYGRLHGARLASVATHAFWSCFFIGAIAFLWAAFIGLRFDFSWGTTMLDHGLLEQVIFWLGAPAAWLTPLNLPDQNQILALLAERSAAADRRTWALYLMSVLAFYGLLPRLLLAMGYALAQRRTKPILDLSAGGYLQLLPVLATSGQQRIDAEGKDVPSVEALAAASQSVTPAKPGDGPPVLIAIELESTSWSDQLSEEEQNWLQQLGVNPKQPLGLANDRAAQRQLQQAIDLLEPKPARIVALCSLARTPDRGIGTWLSELNSLAPVELVLIDADVLKRRGDSIEDRMLDWQQMAGRHGLSIPHLASLAVSK